MKFCTGCGSQLESGQTPCPNCGRTMVASPETIVAPQPLMPEPAGVATPFAASPAPAHTPPVVSPVGSSVRTGPQWQASLPGPLATIPVELLAVVGLMTLGGVLTLWPVLRALPDTLRLVGGGSFATDLGLLLLAVLLVLGFFGLACLILAWRLAHADRVGRGLSYVLLGGLGGALLLGNDHSSTLVIVMLVSFGALAVLVFSPNVSAFFKSGPTAADPTSIVIARTLIAVWAACMLLVGALFVPLSRFGGKWVVVGVIMLGAGCTAISLSKKVAAGDQQARLLLTGLVALYLVLLMVLHSSYPGLLLPVALGIGIGAYLWIPPDARAHFAPAPAPPPNAQ